MITHLVLAKATLVPKEGYFVIMHTNHSISVHCVKINKNRSFLTKRKIATRDVKWLLYYCIIHNIKSTIRLFKPYFIEITTRFDSCTNSFIVRKK